MPASPLALLGFAFVLGLRHAFDVDHLAAVSTIVSARRGARAHALAGALWGVGHTAALLAAALAVVLLHARIPPLVARGLELGVAAMLIGLGGRLLWTLWRGGRLHLHVHAHGGRLHVHPHVHGAGAVADHDHAGSGRTPLLVGLVHGLAGSAGLMLAVVATIPSPGLALAWVAVFGCGSIGGMAAMSTLLGLPLGLAAGRFERVESVLRASAGAASVAVGLALAWRIGVEAGMLGS